MPKRIPVQRVIVVRDGKQVAATVGQPFDFSAEELDDINRMNPEAVRKVIVEDKDLAEAAEKAEKDEAAAAKAIANKAATKTAAKGGSADL